MKWAQFATAWTELQQKLAFRRMRLREHREIVETLKGAKGAETSEYQRPLPFRPDDREKRHEFSQHIGS